MKNRKLWSIEETETLKNNINLTVTELSLLLDRATSSICAKVKREGLKLTTSKTKSFVVCKKCGSDKHRKPSKGWYCKSCVSTAQKNKRKELTDQGQTLQREWWLKQRYNLTITVFNEMLKNQDSRCDICKQIFDKVPRVDHCHSTNKIRGLLCHSCNIAIGILKDNPDTCRNAATYLEKHLDKEFDFDRN